MLKPQNSLILHDETGQPWAVTVGPDGQLQTAKYPDGEPVTFAQKADADIIGKVVTEQLGRLIIGAGDN